MKPCSASHRSLLMIYASRCGRFRYSHIFWRRSIKEADAESLQYFGFIENGAARMGRLLDGLLEYAQIDAMASTPLKTANVEDALDDALRGLNLVLQEAEAVIIRDPLPIITGNQAQLSQLFQNLISNAVKYRSEAAPRIQVSAVLDKGEWVFSVSDNGLGVPPQHREKIFEVFARLHGPEVPGAGLGLAFCSKIVELHHGRIWMEPNPDLYGGSIFKFSLPRA
jgi:signal transduction histidine kinase